MSNRIQAIDMKKFRKARRVMWKEMQQAYRLHMSMRSVEFPQLQDFIMKNKLRRNSKDDSL